MSLIVGMTAAAQQITGLRCAVCLVRNPDRARAGVTIAAGSLVCAEHIIAAAWVAQNADNLTAAAS